MCGCGCLLLFVLLGVLAYTVTHHLWLFTVLLILFAGAMGAYGYKITKH